MKRQDLLWDIIAVLLWVTFIIVTIGLICTFLNLAS